MDKYDKIIDWMVKNSISIEAPENGEETSWVVYSPKHSLGGGLAHDVSLPKAISKAMTREARINRIAEELLRIADLFDGKPEYTKMDDSKGGYIYDPSHKKSKAEAQRDMDTNKPIHETPKGWAEGPEQLDLFKHAPATSNENKDLFGNPLPSDKVLIPVKQEPIVEPPKPVVKPDLKGQEVMPIEPFIPPVAEPPIVEKKTPSVTPPQVVQQKDDPNAMKSAVKILSRKFGATKALEAIPHHILKSIGSNITKFDDKGADQSIMSVRAPDGKMSSVVVRHDAKPVNQMDADMQTLHSVGTAWAISSGLASNPDFQMEAKKAMTKDMDNFVSRYTDLPLPGEERTISPANWIAKGYSTPRAKAAFFKFFSKGDPKSGDKTSLMVNSTIGAMQVASNGEYGFGTPQQMDEDMGTRVANMAGYVAQGMANDSGFLKKNMPLTAKLFEEQMRKG